MRLIIQQDDQFARQPAVAPRFQSVRGFAPLRTDGCMAADGRINQPAQREIRMRVAPGGTAIHHRGIDAPRAHLGAVAWLVGPSTGRLADDGQDGRLGLVQQLTNRPRNNIANPSRSVQLDQLLQPSSARPGQTQRPADGWGGHALSILDGSRSSTSSCLIQQEFTICPTGVTWTARPTRMDGAVDQSPVQPLGHGRLSVKTDQSPGSGHA